MGGLVGWYCYVNRPQTKQPFYICPEHCALDDSHTSARQRKYRSAPGRALLWGGHVAGEALGGASEDPQCRARRPPVGAPRMFLVSFLGESGCSAFEVISTPPLATGHRTTKDAPDTYRLVATYFTHGPRAGIDVMSNISCINSYTMQRTTTRGNVHIVQYKIEMKRIMDTRLQYPLNAPRPAMFTSPPGACGGGA